jgi:hypothetical protein
MKKNLESGLYEAGKFVAATNEEIVASGATREEARENLKLAVKEYRTKPPMVMSGTFNSPGFEVRQDPTGRQVYVYNADRKGFLWARPALAEYLRKLREKTA